jgi:hypothetical protein
MIQSTYSQLKEVSVLWVVSSDSFHLIALYFIIIIHADRDLLNFFDNLLMGYGLQFSKP